MNQSTVPQPLVRGRSRFRLRVRLIDSGRNPYGWELYDEESDRCVRQSEERFRTSAQAWEAGSKATQPRD